MKEVTISKGVRTLQYWYQFFTRCEELVPIFHIVKYAKCEICGSTFVRALLNARECKLWNLEGKSINQEKRFTLLNDPASNYVRLYGSLSKNGGIVVLYNFIAYVPSIFLFLCLQHLATLWVNKTEYYVMCPMTLFENSTWQKRLFSQFHHVPTAG